MNAPDLKSAAANLGPHLNDDQFTACVIGIELDSNAAHHLQHCEDCRAELATFGVAIDGFNDASQLWSESHSVGTLHAAAAVCSPARPLFTTTSWALAACMLLGVGVSAAIYRHHQEEVSRNVAAAEPSEDSPDQIARDNQLLLEINRAIHVDDRSVAQQYGISSASNSKSQGRLTNQ